MTIYGIHVILPGSCAIVSYKSDRLISRFTKALAKPLRRRERTREKVFSRPRGFQSQSSPALSADRPRGAVEHPISSRGLSTANYNMTTIESSAPLRGVKRVQFGILSADEVVSFNLTLLCIYFSEKEQVEKQKLNKSRLLLETDVRYHPRWYQICLHNGGRSR